MVSQVLFCSTLCGFVWQNPQCTDKSYAHCKTCTTGFIKANPANPVDACIVNPALSNSSFPKY